VFTYHRLTIGLMLSIASVLLLMATATAVQSKQDVVSVQLATVYNNQDIQSYLVSEKYDGIRAIWKNGELRTRKGNLIHAPAWFIQDLPDIWLDGELWYKRNDFEYVASTVSKHSAIDSEWRKIKYMVFDAPNTDAPFHLRAASYSALLHELDISHVLPVEQLRIDTNDALAGLLQSYTANGAEGLMIHKADALFIKGRSNNLLKLKKDEDAEAVVLKHIQGKGKYSNSLGSMLVQYRNAQSKTIQFKIGTGFSDEERNNPPPIGSTVTFRHFGYTKGGVPKFASFMRIRNEL
jgi:DNA ligase-1